MTSLKCFSVASAKRLSALFLLSISLFAWPSGEKASGQDLGSPPAFHPGEAWLDTNGKPINAHGGGMLFHDGTYYWFGEHKLDGLAGDVAQVGVHVYSSKD